MHFSVSSVFSPINVENKDINDQSGDISFIVHPPL